jgi:CheY-like chemotaxis protein
MAESPPLILLIEDEHDIRDAICVLLEMEGHRVEQCANGEEAWTWLQAHPPPDLVLLDLMMPVLDGQSLLARLARTRLLQGVPIIVLSGSPFRPEGAVAYLRKPMSVDQLLAEVNRYLPSRPDGTEGPPTS